ncbi:MAG: serine hydrolase domain-containing protein [Myxococcota bacterium]
MITQEQALRLTARVASLNFPPGEAFGYSNTGYLYLAEIVKRVSGQSLADFAAARIFRPLGMKRTHFATNHEAIVPNRADSYEKREGEYRRQKLNFSLFGGTSLMTTTAGLSRWAKNFDEHRVGDAELFAAFNSPSVLNNGDPVQFKVIDGEPLLHAKGQLVRVYRGVRVFKHGVHYAAFRAFLARFPEHDVTIATLSNDEHYEIFKNGMAIAEMVLGDALSKPSSPKAPQPEFATQASDGRQVRFS